MAGINSRVSKSPVKEIKPPISPSLRKQIATSKTQRTVATNTKSDFYCNHCLTAYYLSQNRNYSPPTLKDLSQNATVATNILLTAASIEEANRENDGLFMSTESQKDCNKKSRTDRDGTPIASIARSDNSSDAANNGSAAGFVQGFPTSPPITQLHNSSLVPIYLPVYMDKAHAPMFWTSKEVPKSQQCESCQQFDQGDNLKVTCEAAFEEIVMSKIPTKMKSKCKPSSSAENTTKNVIPTFNNSCTGQNNLPEEKFVCPISTDEEWEDSVLAQEKVVGSKSSIKTIINVNVKDDTEKHINNKNKKDKKVEDFQKIGRNKKSKGNESRRNTKKNELPILVGEKKTTTDNSTPKIHEVGDGTYFIPDCEINRLAIELLTDESATEDSDIECIQPKGRKSRVELQERSTAFNSGRNPQQLINELLVPSHSNFVETDMEVSDECSVDCNLKTVPENHCLSGQTYNNKGVSEIKSHTQQKDQPSCLKNMSVLQAAQSMIPTNIGRSSSPTKATAFKDIPASAIMMLLAQRGGTPNKNSNLSTLLTEINSKTNLATNHSDPKVSDFLSNSMNSGLRLRQKSLSPIRKNPKNPNDDNSFRYLPF